MAKFNPDLPTLEGEEVDDGLEEQVRESVSAELAQLQPLQSMVTSPEWEAMDRWAWAKEQEAIESMVATRDAAQTLEWRARVGFAREIRQLPDWTALQVKRLTGALEEDDGE